METPFEDFSQFLSTTPWAGKTELFAMLSREVDFVKTITLASQHYETQFAYMEQYLAPHAVSFPHLPNERWVPVQLLKYIHGNSRPYNQRLDRFIQLCIPAGAYCTYSKQEMKRISTGNVGIQFLSWAATFAFLISDEDSDEEVEMPALQLAGYLKDDKEVKAQGTSADVEEKLASEHFPEGAHSAAEQFIAVEDAEPSTPHETQVLPEIEMNLFSTVVIEDEEYIFLHDLEKAADL